MRLQLPARLDALPAPIAAATDTNLIAENTIFPVHRVMLDSGLLAEVFLIVAEQQPQGVLEIFLPGDKALVVHTALKYIYAGYPVHQSLVVLCIGPMRACEKTRAQWLETEVESLDVATDDAEAVITLAHKYALNSLLEACEAFLVELAQEEMEDHGSSR